MESKELVVAVATTRTASQTATL